MPIAFARSLALQKGFTLRESESGEACQLIDRHLGLPVLNPRTLTVHFSAEEAVEYLKDLPDRPVGGKSGRW
jgi:hypothetical protein